MTDLESEAQDAAAKRYPLIQRYDGDTLPNRDAPALRMGYIAGYIDRAQRETRITITIEHEGGNTITGTPEQVLNYGHLTTGWRELGSEDAPEYYPPQPTEGEPSDAQVHAAWLSINGVVTQAQIRTALRAALQVDNQ